MDNNKNLYSKEGIDKLKVELEDLVNVQRPQIIIDLKAAREQGDLSENADYDAAKNRQAEIEARISQIENILNNATTFVSSNSKTNGITFGSIIEYTDLRNNKSFKCRLVSELESNPINKEMALISIESPFGKAVIGKNSGIEVQIVGIEHPYKIKINSFK